MYMQRVNVYTFRSPPKGWPAPVPEMVPEMVLQRGLAPYRRRGRRWCQRRYTRGVWHPTADSAPEEPDPSSAQHHNVDCTIHHCLSVPTAAISTYTRSQTILLRFQTASNSFGNLEPPLRNHITLAGKPRSSIGSTFSHPAADHDPPLSFRVTLACSSRASAASITSFPHADHSTLPTTPQIQCRLFL